MAIVYVKHTAWGANTPLYASVDVALDNMGAGDTAKVSDLHVGPTTSATLASPGTHDNLCKVICVEDLDVNVSSAGAIEGSSTAVISTTGSLYFRGITFKHTQDIDITGQSLAIFEKCTTEATGSGAGITESNTGVKIILIDHTMKSAGSCIEPASLGNFIIDNFTFDETGVIPTYFFASGTGNSILAKLSNSNLSPMVSGHYLVNGSTSTLEVIDVNIERVKIGSGCEITNSPMLYPTCKIDAGSVDNGTGYHYFEYHRYEGKVLENTSVYRSGGSYYDKDAPLASNFSAQFQPNANVEAYIQPLEIKIADIELDLTVANTLTFHLGFGDDTLVVEVFNNDEAWIKLVQNDGTNLALGVSTETKPATITTTPTELTASTETWTGLTHTNTDKRQIAITTDVVAGLTNGQVTAYLCIAKYVSTLEIFACAKPVVT